MRATSRTSTCGCCSRLPWDEANNMGAISPGTGHPTRRWRAAAAVLAVIALAVWTLVASVFTVDVTQYALDTRFGKVLRVLDQPGLHVKAPFDTIVTLDKS